MPCKSVKSLCCLGAGFWVVEYELQTLVKDEEEEEQRETETDGRADGKDEE